MIEKSFCETRYRLRGRASWRLSRRQDNFATETLENGRAFGCRQENCQARYFGRDREAHTKAMGRGTHIRSECARTRISRSRATQAHGLVSVPVHEWAPAPGTLLLAVQMRVLCRIRNAARQTRTISLWLSLHWYADQGMMRFYFKYLLIGLCR